MSLGIGPHDHGCECTRCTSRRAQIKHDTNFNALTEANKDMNEAERGEFDNFFIGALSAKVSREDWDDAIRTALRCCADRWSIRPLR